VPAVVVGSFRAWPKGKLIFGFHPVRVQYGPPIEVSHLKGDEIVELIDSTVPAECSRNSEKRPEMVIDA
jgi:1-acyl-sn-glycerol-3-phosphate acyltransferase